MTERDQKRQERSAVQDRFIAGEISAEECKQLLEAIDAKYRRRPSRRDRENHQKLMALYAPIEAN